MKIGEVKNWNDSYASSAMKVKIINVYTKRKKFTEKSICRERDELNSVIVPEILRRSGDL